MAPLGKFLLIAGVVMALVGLVLMFSDRLPWLGRLPGDINIERENFQFHFPITTSILLSVIVSLILWAIGQFRK